MFTGGWNIESYSLSYPCHKINQLQNITAYFTVLKTESKFCFILRMDTGKAILCGNKPHMSNLCNFKAPVKSPTLGHIIWAKPCSRLRFLIKCPRVAVGWGGEGISRN